MNNHFYEGFEKTAMAMNATPPPPVTPKAGPFENLRKAINSPKNKWRGRIGAAIVAPLAIAGLGYKAIDKTIGAPTPTNDI